MIFSVGNSQCLLNTATHLLQKPEAEEEEPETEMKGGEGEDEFPEDPLFGKTFEVPSDAEEIDLPKGMKYKGEWKVRQTS